MISSPIWGSIARLVTLSLVLRFASFACCMDLGQAYAQLSPADQDRFTEQGFAFGQPERLAHVFDSDDEDDVEELAEQIGRRRRRSG
jgi:hypothetical protein